MAFQILDWEIISINGLAVKLSFNDADIAQLNPTIATEIKAEIEAKAIEESKADAPAPIQVNDTIRQLSGREHQQMMRVMRQFAKGQLNYEQASVLLSTSLGLSSEEITLLLTIED